MVPENVRTHPGKSSAIEIHELPNDEVFYKLVAGFGFLEFNEEQWEDLHELFKAYRKSKIPTWIRFLRNFGFGLTLGFVLSIILKIAL